MDSPTPATDSGGVTLVDEYLGRLPNGLHSYPEARCKASVINSFVGQHRGALAEVVDEPVRELLTSPPPDSLWVPEVHATVIFVAQRMLFFDSDEAYVQFAEEENFRLISSPLYRMMFKLFSPLRAGKLISSGYARFHQGSESRVIASTPTSFDIHAVCPEHLFPTWLIHAQFTGAVAALRVGGNEHARLELLEASPAHALGRVTFG